MQDFLRITAVCLTGALLSTVLRGEKPEMRLAVALTAGLCAMSLMLDGMRQSAAAVYALAERAFADASIRGILLKAVGVALTAEFASRLCADAGESALAGRIELGGRVALSALALPLIRDLTGRLIDLLP